MMAQSLKPPDRLITSAMLLRFRRA